MEASSNLTRLRFVASPVTIHEIFTITLLLSGKIVTNHYLQSHPCCPCFYPHNVTRKYDRSSTVDMNTLFTSTDRFIMFSQLLQLQGNF